LTVAGSTSAPAKRVSSVMVVILAAATVWYRITFTARVYLPPVVVMFLDCRHRNICVASKFINAGVDRGSFRGRESTIN